MSNGRQRLTVVDDPLAPRPTPDAAPDPPAGPEDPAAGPPAPAPGAPNGNDNGGAGAPPGRQRRPQRAPAEGFGEATHLLGARVPRAVQRRFDRAHLELQESRPAARKQDLLAALVWGIGDPADEATVGKLARLVDQYDRARGQ